MFDPLDDRFRWCIYCGADCWLEKENQLHALDCPQITGIFPVTEQEVQRGLGCVNCRLFFGPDEVYTQVSVGGNVYEVMCLGCAVLNAIS